MGAHTGAMFAAAEDFSHLIDNDLTSSSSLADVIGAGAVSRHDNAGTLVLTTRAAAASPL